MQNNMASKDTFRAERFHARRWLLASAIVPLLLGCQTTGSGSKPVGATTNVEGSPPPVMQSADNLDVDVTGGQVFVEPSPITVDRRTLPRIGVVSPGSDGVTGLQRPRFDNERLTIALPPQPVPEFINSVFGEVLGLGFTLGPGVSSMADIVAFRSANNIRKSDLFDAAVSALNSYGVAVYQGEEQLEVVREDSLRQQAPRFIRSRARSAVPRSLRPVVQFVDLYAISVDEMMQILNQSFPNSDKLVFKPNPGSNSITLTGLPKDVDRALSIINQMDELRFGGQQVATVKIANWDVENLAETASRLLQTEGYSVSANNNVVRAITLRTIPFTQQIVVFAREPGMLEYAIATLQRLDQSADQAENQAKPRIYNAQHYKAEDLIGIVARVLDEDAAGGASSSGPRLAAQNVATQSQDEDQEEQGSAADRSPEGFVIDEQSNRIIFNATDARYTEILALMRQLDTPPPEVLIEVTIAEVTLTADTRSGVEFLINQIGTTGFRAGTNGGLGLATGGLTGRFTSRDDLIVDFGAFSSNNFIQVLSTPRVVTKSGATATIQVGTDVPIITTQSAAPTLIGGTSDIIQSVEYRETGVILEVSPVVLSSDRIDLAISQEVSSAEENTNQSIGSPVISNRNITSELTLQDGQSAILGGLIENRYTEGGSGVPFLKDLPMVGRLFSTESLRDTDTILLFMITPYILDTADDRARAVDAFAGRMNEALRTTNKQNGTLTPSTESSVVVPRSPIDAPE
jgi:general secretion pathway protein D